jgi:predicted GNAT superfamily acetyltransferase
LAAAIVIRDVEGLAEARRVEELQAEVWGMDDRDITPLTHLVAVKEAGGQLIGAFDDQEMVGFVYGFPGVEHGRPIHHSHLLAVRPEYRNEHVGYRLKLAQRAAVLAQGIGRITWTFDPLQSANAYFNFRKLGATCDAYRVDFYGAGTSSFLHRAGTDRLLLTWDIDTPRVHRRVLGEPAGGPPAEGVPALVRIAPCGAPGELDLSGGLAAEEAVIEIPDDINALGREHPKRTVQWREVTRRAFGEAFGAGFRVDDFHRVPRPEHPAGVYVLRRAARGEGSP